MVSKARVVLVSAESICSQKLSVADVAVDGMLTCWSNVSVVAEPWPSSQASKAPECAGSEAELLMAREGVLVEVTTHGEGFTAPPSNPRFPISSVPGAGVGVGLGVGVGVGVGV